MTLADDGRRPDTHIGENAGSCSTIATMSNGDDKRRRNHLTWIGPVITFLGMVSYFLVFVRWPMLRDFPWINLPLVLVGFATSVAAFRRRRRESLVSRLLAWSGLGFSTLVAGLFCFYVFYYSSTLPVAGNTLQIERAPGIALTDQHGDVVSLADMRGNKVILVFFRGFW